MGRRALVRLPASLNEKIQEIRGGKARIVNFLWKSQDFLLILAEGYAIISHAVANIRV